MLKNRRYCDLTVAGHRHRRPVSGMDGKALSAVHEDRFDVRDMGNAQRRELLFRHVTNINGQLNSSTCLIRPII